MQDCKSDRTTVRLLKQRDDFPWKFALLKFYRQYEFTKKIPENQSDLES